MLKLRKFLSCTLALLLTVSMPLAALAEEYDLVKGSISVNAREDGQYVTQDNGVQDHKEEAETVITQTITEEAPSTTNTITITAEQDATANVTLDGVNIDVGDTGDASNFTPGEAAIQTSGVGNVTIELDGSNTVQGGIDRAGVEKNNGGNLTITNTDEVTESDPGSLDATGGECGAGIGGGFLEDGSNITITGNAQVEATGGNNGAGIGGGYGGDGSDITISGNAQVEATGGVNGAGIGGGINAGSGGGGSLGSGSNITITGSAEVTAKGGGYGAGIGGGNEGKGIEITIDGEAQVEATGGVKGAGIGGGFLFGDGSKITIGGSAQVEATGGVCGAGIGGGAMSNGRNITITGSAEVTAQGGLGASGIGGGSGMGKGSSITVSQDAQVKAQGGSADAEQQIRNAGPAIGSGGGYSQATEAVVTTVALDAGWIAKYEPGRNLNTDAPKSLTYHNGSEVTTSENVSLVPEQTPTCTEAGHEDGFTVDGTLVAVTIPALGHSFTNYVSDNNATYESDGTKTAKCDRCDETDTLPDPGSKLVKPAESVTVSPKPAAVVEYSGMDESAFWQEVARQIEAAAPGDTIEVNAGGICTIPYWVIDAAVEHGVALSIHWRCGEDFIIDRKPDQQLWVYSFTTLPQMLGK